MQNLPLDLSRLLGFDGLADQGAEPLNFRQDNLAVRFGAKVGVEPVAPAASDTVKG